MEVEAGQVALEGAGGGCGSQGRAERSGADCHFAQPRHKVCKRWAAVWCSNLLEAAYCNGPDLCRGLGSGEAWHAGIPGWQRWRGRQKLYV